MKNVKWSFVVSLVASCALCAALAGCAGGASSSAASSAASASASTAASASTDSASASSASESAAASSAASETAASESASAASASAASESASDTSSSAASASAASASAESADPAIGAKTDTSAAVTLTNDLDRPVSGFGLGITGNWDNPVAIDMAGKTIEVGAKAKVNYEPMEGVDYYDLNVTCDGEVLIIHNIPLKSIDALSMQISDGVAYAVYTLDGNEVNTLEQELADIAAAEAAAAAPAPTYYNAPQGGGQQSGDRCADVVLR